MTDAIISNLRDARRRTLVLVEDLSDEQLGVQYSPNVNPFLWELGHIAFFHDAFVRGYAQGREPLLEVASQLYDSFRVDHEDRWGLALPSRVDTLAYMSRVSESIEDEGCVGEREAYCHQLAMLHEDMHGEAFAYMRQFLGYPAPGVGSERNEALGPWPGDVSVASGEFFLGTSPDQTGFVFDNEKWAHRIEVPAFDIARAPVTNAEYLKFVEDGGYDRRELWSGEGWVWRQKSEVQLPANWLRRDEGWYRRDFSVQILLPPDQPVAHVSQYEAEAFCTWAGRRLPTEAEWEMAASLPEAGDTKRRYPWGDEPWNAELANLDYQVGHLQDVAAYPDGDSAAGCRQMLGNIWEWTSSAFYPFPGYLVDLPYREYSAPWFGDRKVLKGGAFATRSRLIHNTYRNFFTPDRRDVFAGFRTCATKLPL